MLLELFPCGGGSVRYTKILAVIVRRPGPPWRYTAATPLFERDGVRAVGSLKREQYTGNSPLTMAVAALGLTGQMAAPRHFLLMVGIFKLQRRQQMFRRPQIRCVKTFGELMIDGRQYLSPLVTSTLAQAQASQTHDGAQLQGEGPLLPG
jgi:hypothetical protein